MLCAQSETLSVLIDVFEEKAIRYAIWKNVFEVSLNNDFAYDFDIYLHNDDFILFTDILSQFTVFEASYRHSHFPGIHHFFVFDNVQRKFVHLHVYTELNTGHTWTKEFTLHLMEYDFGERIHIDGVTQKWKFLPKPYLQEIHRIRAELKSRNILNKVYFKRDSLSYVREGQFLNHIGNVERRDLSIRYSSRLNDLSYIYCLMLAFARRFLKSFKPKMRRQLKDGKIVAITGTDGAGKSTLVSSLFADLSKFNLRVKIISPGRLSKPKSKKSVSHRPQLKNFRCIATGFIRLVLCNIYAQYFKLRGFIIIADRWPGVKVGEMDSPKITNGFLMVFEQIMYKNIIPADAVIKLEVDVETLLKRNRARDKIGKETDEEIQNRHDENKEMTPKCKKLFKYKNDGSQREAENAILKIVADMF